MEDQVIMDGAMATTPAPSGDEPAFSAADVNTEPAGEVETSAEPEADDDAMATTPASGDADDDAQQAPAITIPVRYNHQSRELTADEAAEYAQKGMRYDDLHPTLNKLQFLASNNGRSVEQLVDDIYAADERQLYNRLLDEAGGNEDVANRLLELEKSKRQSTFEGTQQRAQEQEADERQQLENRLASDYLELQAEFPELKEFKDVPQAVVNDAIRNNRTLLDAYLRYERAEGKKIAAVQKKTKETAQVALGSKAEQPPSDVVDPGAQAVMQGIASVFN